MARLPMTKALQPADAHAASHGTDNMRQKERIVRYNVGAQLSHAQQEAVGVHLGIDGSIFSIP
jgi:hypothetical protein